MLIERENNLQDKISFQLYVYIVNQAQQQEVLHLLEGKVIECTTEVVNTVVLEHNYYISIDLEQPLAADDWVEQMKGILDKDSPLEHRFRIYCNITSAYDHFGVEIPYHSTVIKLQEQLHCSLDIYCIVIE